LGACCVAFVVRDVSVHETPQPLDRIQMQLYLSSAQPEEPKAPEHPALLRQPHDHHHGPTTVASRLSSVSANRTRLGKWRSRFECNAMENLVAKRSGTAVVLLILDTNSGAAASSQS
jgi:hypothetical protein